jgi:hypothetical protein
MRRTIVLLAAMAAMVLVYAGTALAEDTLDAHYLDVTDPRCVLRGLDMR